MRHNANMKKLLALSLALFMVFCASGCTGDSADTSVPTEHTEPAVQTRPVTEPETQPATEPETQPTEDNGMETIYCLVQRLIGSRERFDYKYDDAGNLTGIQQTIARSVELWNEELGVYEYIPGSLSESPYTMYDCQYSYDSAGNITEARYIKYDDDGSVEMDYSNNYRYFLNENGEIVYVEYRTTQPLVSPLNYYFTYEDGKIVNVDAYMTDQNGEVYGDVVENYSFDYDDQGQLSGEHAVFTYSEYHFEYTYNIWNQLTRVDYLGIEDGEEIRRTHDFQYENKKHAISQVVTQEGRSYEDQYGFYMEDQMILLGAPEYGEGWSFFHDDSGRLIAAEGDSYMEFTYAPMEVTHEQAEHYYRQQQMSQSVRKGWFTHFYYPVFFYHLIPNPIW